MKPRTRTLPRLSRRQGFSLMEMLLVLAIIAILSTLGLAVMAGAEEDASRSRTRVQIDRISLLLNQRLEEAVYRVLPVYLNTGALTVKEQQIIRTAAIAELLRVEFPTRQTDLLDTPADPFPANTGNVAIPAFDWSTFPNPQLLIRHRSRLGMPIDGNSIPSGPPPADEWTPQHQSAECLYAILSSITTEDGKSALSLVSETEIGDTDGDGRREILDAFGEPLLLDLVVRDLIDEHGNWLTSVDPHIDPRFDLNPADTTIQDYPVEISRFQLLILSPNAAGKLDKQ